jgi:hypothetical protein
VEASHPDPSSAHESRLQRSRCCPYRGLLTLFYPITSGDSHTDACSLSLYSRGCC